MIKSRFALIILVGSSVSRQMKNPVRSPVQLFPTGTVP
jgi:hypothetical protein